MDKGNDSWGFGWFEFKNILKVFAWTFGAGVIALILDAVSLLEVPVQYAFIIPIINTVLYALKEWVVNNK